MKKTSESIIQQFKNLQKIGSGLTSTVYKAFDPQLGQICLKVIDNKFYSKPIGKLLIDNQIMLLKQFNHKYLLKLKKHQQNQNENIIVTQYCEGGNLYDRIKKSKIMSEQQTLRIADKIVQALEQIHLKNVIHRDLKPQNIFFKNSQPVLADFGFAVHIENKSLNKINAGSPLYMAPQTLQNLQFSFQSDIFSLGVIIYQMLKGYTPWGGSNQKQLLKNMLSIKPSIQLQNKKLQKLIYQCLQPKKQKRACFSDIINFFKDQNKSTNQKTVKKYTQKNEISLFHDSKNQIRIKQKSYSLMVNQKNNNKKATVLIQKVKISNNDKNKQNNQSMNISFNNIKTHRLTSVELQKHNKNRSFAMDQYINQDELKTKRAHKGEKLDNNFKLILERLNPDKMKFLPSSMIEKFKFILHCYSKIIQGKPTSIKIDHQSSHTIVNNVPKSLNNDKIALQIVKCKDQRQFCSQISGYVGRMYRLAKNYKIYPQFMKDIECLYQRVESFCA